MTDQAYRLAVALSTLALISAIYSWGVFWWPIQALRIDNYYQDASPLMLFLDLLRLVFIIAPVVALIAALGRSRWSAAGLMVFAAVSWVFGISAIPFIALAFPPALPRTIAVTACNLIVIALAIWLLWGPGNLASHRKTTT
ncbi:MAG: hypothetical protein ACXIUZ_03135 [Lysobacteraceae bacterium]